MEVLVWLGYIIVDAIVNWYIIEKRKVVPNYITLTIVRGWAFILIGILIDVEPNQFIQWFGFATCSFWLIFDTLLNKLRGKKLFYIGTNSRIDQFGLKHPVIYFSLKVVAIILAILSVIYY